MARGGGRAGISISRSTLRAPLTVASGFCPRSLRRRPGSGPLPPPAGTLFRPTRRGQRGRWYPKSRATTRHGPR
eukprot:797893-Pyramimonas_sp.AAC.1